MKNVILIVAILLFGLSCTKEQEENQVLPLNTGSITVYYNEPLNYVLFDNDNNKYEYTMFTCQLSNRLEYTYMTKFDNIKIGSYVYFVSRDMGYVSQVVDGTIQVDSGDNSFILTLQ